ESLPLHGHKLPSVEGSLCSTDALTQRGADRLPGRLGLDDPQFRPGSVAEDPAVNRDDGAAELSRVSDLGERSPLASDRDPGGTRPPPRGVPRRAGSWWRPRGGRWGPLGRAPAGGPPPHPPPPPPRRRRAKPPPPPRSPRR